MSGESSQNERAKEFHAANIELMNALEEWKNAGAHVSRVNFALLELIEAVFARVLTTNPQQDGDAK